MRIAVLGGTGFLGSRVLARAADAGLDCTSVAAVRIGPITSGGAREAARSWRSSHSEEVSGLCRDLAGFDVVINAAGLAAPGSGDRPGLFAANAVMPLVVASAARAAGVRRLVHVSTAAVQGRLDPLDETTQWSPASPYAESKTEAERGLLTAEPDEAPPELVVYRPTSVHGPGRYVTGSLVRLAGRMPALPVSGRGDDPVPVALVDNVAAGLVFSATSPKVGGVVLQPWEGLTARRLLELFGARRIVSVPRPLVRPALGALARASAGAPSLVARMRRLELVLQGQGVTARHLSASGFEPPVGVEGWAALVAGERARQAETASPRASVPGPGT